jgi:hypothetical protein
MPRKPKKIHVELGDLKTPWRPQRDRYGRAFNLNTLTGEKVWAQSVLDEMQFLRDFCEQTSVTKIMGACRGWKAEKVEHLDGWPGLMVKDGHIISIDLKDKKITGNIPTSISNLKYLTTLNMKHNLMDGIIPPSITQCERLEWLELSNNNFWGHLPKDIGDMSNLRMVWLDKNQLEGPIPDSLAQCKKLHLLWINHNRLTGQLPEFMAKMPNLENLCVQNNNFTGTISAELFSKEGLKIEVQENMISSPVAPLDVALYPCYVIHRDDLLRLSYLYTHEEAKKKGLVQAVKSRFTNRNSHIGGEWYPCSQIGFFSHHWLSFTNRRPHPDEPKSGSKLKQMQAVANEKPDVQWFFFDYLCVPQVTDGEDGGCYRENALRSLAYYIQSCGKFFILVGEGDEDVPCSLGMYHSRGWCRFEYWIASCPVYNIEHDHWERIESFVCNKDLYTIQPYFPPGTHANAYMDSGGCINFLSRKIHFALQEDRLAIIPLVRAFCDYYATAIMNSKAGMQPLLKKTERFKLELHGRYQVIEHLRREAEYIEKRGVGEYEPVWKRVVEPSKKVGEAPSKYWYNLQTGDSAWLLPEEQAKLDKIKADKEEADLKRLLQGGYLGFKEYKLYVNGEATYDELYPTAQAKEDEATGGSKRGSKRGSKSRRRSKKGRGKSRR